MMSLVAHSQGSDPLLISGFLSLLSSLYVMMFEILSIYLYTHCGWMRKDYTYNLRTCEIDAENDRFKEPKMAAFPVTLVGK